MITAELSLVTACSPNISILLPLNSIGIESKRIQTQFIVFISFKLYIFLSVKAFLSSFYLLSLCVKSPRRAFSVVNFVQAREVLLPVFLIGLESKIKCSNIY